MKNRSLIVLLILFFGGLLALWWADYARIPTSEQRRRMSGRVLPELIDVSPGEVQRVEILGGAEPLAFEHREGGLWQMVEPSNVLADRSRVDALVQNLKNLAPLPDAGTVPGEPSSYGLAPPERTVRLYGQGKAPLATLELGETVRESRYVRPSGQDAIEVVDPNLLDAVNLPPVDWRERALLTLPTFEVQRVSVERPDQTFQVERHRTGLADHRADPGPRRRAGDRRHPRGPGGLAGRWRRERIRRGRRDGPRPLRAG